MLHAIAVHFPVALAVVGLPLVYLTAVMDSERDTLRWVTAGCYALLVIVAFLAVRTGEGAEAELPNYLPAEVWDAVDQHRWLGEWVWLPAALTTLFLVLSAVRVRWFRVTAISLAMLASLATAGWVAYTGHVGGTLVYEHGLGTPAMEAMYRDADPPAPPADEDAEEEEEDPTDDPVEEPAEEVEDDPADLDDGYEPGIQPIDMDEARYVTYVQDIEPIMANYCVGCHSGGNPASELDLTTYANIFEEGAKAGPAVIPGEPDESPLVQYIRGILRPQMPRNEPPLSEDDLHAIRMWIAAGAPEDEDDVEPEEGAAEHEEPSEAIVATPYAGAPRESLEELMFSADPVRRHILRRELRLALLPDPPEPPETEYPAANAVDQFIGAAWEELDHPREPEVADDATFLRRVYLDLAGVIPSAEEARAFMEDGAPDNRERLIEELLADTEAYAIHWAPFWEDALASNGNHQGGVRTRGNFRDWIIDSFAANKPYDLMVAELLDPAMPDHPGGFVQREDHTLIMKSAADTAQVFLGTSLKCAACHNHFDNPEWPQTRFLSFAGFFAENDLELIRCEEKTGYMVPTGFMEELPGMPADVPETVEERIRRAAQLITDPTNPRFARNIVNRLWKRFLGYGLYEPADDFREDKEGSHPELLDWLAQDFMRNGYDLKHTIRLILNSRTYQLRYDPELEDAYDISDPDAPRYFRSPRLRRLTAEQILDSVHLAANQELPRHNRTYADENSTPLTRSLGRPSTRNEIATSRPDDVAVVQALELMNGPHFHSRVYSGRFIEALGQDLMDGREPEDVFEDLYWAVMSQAPGPDQREAGAAFLSESLAGLNMDAEAEPQAPEPELWLAHDVPAGSQREATDMAFWEWRDADEDAPFADEGGIRLQTAGAGESVQHYFREADDPLRVDPGDTLFAWVYIDPEDPPATLMMQWHVETWDQRAYWGEDAIDHGARNPMGALPPAGEWVRLEALAHEAGLSEAGTPVNGWAFDQHGGVVHWGPAGVIRAVSNPATEPVGDALWALLAGPAFQYIH